MFQSLETVSCGKANVVRKTDGNTAIVVKFVQVYIKMLILSPVERAVSLLPI